MIVCVNHATELFRKPSIRDIVNYVFSYRLGLLICAGLFFFALSLQASRTLTTANNFSGLIPQHLCHLTKA